MVTYLGGSILITIFALGGSIVSYNLQLIYNQVGGSIVSYNSGSIVSYNLQF